MKEYKKFILFLVCIALLKTAFALLNSNDQYFSFRDLFASVLNSENIVSLTNESRKAAGLNALEVNSKLESAARKKAEDMLKNQYFAHKSPSGKMAWDFMGDAGYAYWLAAENLAMNFDSAESVTKGWLASIKHKENILNDKYTQIGIGVATGKFLDVDATVIVQMFGRPFRSNIAPITNKSKKTSTSKYTMRSSSLAASIPNVKEISIKKYISELESENSARWIPMANVHQMYAFNEKVILTKKMFDTLLIYTSVFGICIFAYRFYRRKVARNKHRV